MVIMSVVLVMLVLECVVKALVVVVLEGCVGTWLHVEVSGC